MAGAASLRSVAVGDVRITYLPDGIARLTPREFFPASDEEGWKRHPEFLDEEGWLICSLGELLIENGDRKVLLGTGFGDRFADLPPFGSAGGGKLLASLTQAGVSPDEIDTVVYTHLHFDHVGWATTEKTDGWTPGFPNARYMVRAAEWNFWEGKDDPAGMGKASFEEPLRDRIELFDSDVTVAPGISILSTPGHTPGHSSVVVSSGTERAIVLGDVIHCPVQLEEEEWACAFDVDPALARATRDRLVAELEGSSTLVGGGHFSDFTFGRVMRGEGRRLWTVDST
jgi:glyoxylase-like metal-dependent hydrolase (beta-lactamase superfamily II)